MELPSLRWWGLVGVVAAGVALTEGGVAFSATGASTLEVRNGTLTLVKTAGEPSLATLEYYAPVWSAVDYGGGFEPFSSEQERWPGLVPSPGPGCAAGPGQYGAYDCSGVTGIDISGGDDHEFFEVTGGGPGVPVRLAGGGGRDGLLALRNGDTVVDGGAGDDSLAVDRGRVSGGPGNDTIDIRATESAHGKPVRFLPVQIDCGPGSDLLMYGELRNRGHLPATVDAASCPPVITPLRRYQSSFPGDLPLVRLPASRRLRLTILRTPEALHGTVGADRGRPACTRPKRFRVAAGGTLRVTLRLTAEGVRRSRSMSRSGSYCSLGLSAKDPQGDRVQEFFPFLIRPASGGSGTPRKGR